MNYLKVTPESKESTLLGFDDVAAIALEDSASSFIKPGIQTPRIQTELITIIENGALPHVENEKSRIYFVSDGQANIAVGNETCRLSQGAMIYHPSRSLQSDAQVTLLSPELNLFTIILETEVSSSVPEVSYGKWLGDTLFVVGPDDPPAYSPDNHHNTVNQCLFINNEIEVLRGKIGSGGGSNRHSHDNLEQLNFFLAPWKNLVSYIPHGVPHGGERFDEAMDLVVVYSPPLGESRKYVKVDNE